MKIFKNAIAVLMLIVVSKAPATIYPLSDGKGVDLMVIQDALSDLNVRLDLFKRAKHSIELISHTHTSGEFGLAISTGLREALGRGVKVKYLYEKIATMAAGDLSNNTAAFLMDQELPIQAEMITARPLQKLLSPFSIFDLFHQKIVIIDRGTPNEMILTGGRNHDELNLKSSDFSYLFRIVEGEAEPSVMKDLKAVFTDTWELASQHYKMEKPVLLNSKQKNMIAQYQISEFLTSPPETGRRILGALTQPARHSDHLQDFQFRANTYRLITNDALATIKYNRASKQKPDKNFVDDITSYISSLMEYATKVELNSYIMMMPEPLMEATQAVVAKGGEVLVYTNNDETYGRLVPISAIGKVAAGYNYESYVRLAGQDNQGKLQVMMFDASLGEKEENPIEYSHRKLALFEIPRNGEPSNPKHFAWLGSYNFTKSSATRNDEMGVMVSDSRLHSYLSKINQADGQKFHVELTEAQARAGAQKGKFVRALCRQAFTSIF